MRHTKILIVWFVLFSFGAHASASVDEFIQGADQLLKQEVKNGRVDYTGIKQNFDHIDKLYRQLSDISLENASDREKKAFYINAYNIIVLHEVARYYPLKSPMDKSGFFDQVKHSVAGESLTLNALEINKLIKPYQDPKVHFALACAAKSCPPLANFAYLPQQLDEQLIDRTRLSINNPDFIRVDQQDREVQVSKIFDWYKKDFTQDGQSVVAFINQYRDQKIPADFSLGYYEYNWQLNDQAQP